MKTPRKIKQKTTKQAAPKKRVLLKPPPILPDEEREMFATSDFVELGYREIEKLRGIKKRTSEQNSRLTEHDAIEKRIEDAPREVMAEAHKAIDHGTGLLLKLIRSGKLEQKSSYTDGTIAIEDDEAFSCLDSRLDYLNRQLVRLAGIGVPRARDSLFYQAKALAEAFIRLAQAHPGDFINCAKCSLTMPSLRSRNPKYTADAAAIGKAIHLSDNHPAGEKIDFTDRLGELCAYLVAKILDSIAWDRRQFQWESESLERLQAFSETAEAYRGVTIEDYMRGRLYPTTFDLMMVSANLPEFSEDPKAWWDERIKPTLRYELSRLKDEPSRNAALWTELCRLTDNGTDGAKWKALSDNCRNKVNQYARQAGAKVFA